MKKWIWFDMDGTIADFYGVPTWKEDIESFNSRPYEVCTPLLNMSLLARLLNKLQSGGYCIGVISWSSKTATAEFDKAVEIAKKNWLGTHLASVRFDSIEVVRYGTPKHEGRNGILFDDNAEVRNDWNKSGATAKTEKEIIEVLKGLLKAK